MLILLLGIFRCFFKVTMHIDLHLLKLDLLTIPSESVLFNKMYVLISGNIIDVNIYYCNEYLPRNSASSFTCMFCLCFDLFSVYLLRHVFVLIHVLSLPVISFPVSFMSPH